MGRVKMKIQKVESKTGRLITFSKRKGGLLKKTNELQVLCDIDVLLLMFSPQGRPLLWKGKDSSIEKIIARYADLSPGERARRKLENYDVLKRSYRNSDHKVVPQDFLGSSYQTIEDLTARANLLQNQLSEVQKRLSDWKNTDKVDSLVLLEQMEDYLRELLDQIHAQKRRLGKQNILAVGCTNEFQNVIQLPFSVGVEQQFPGVDNQNIASTLKPNLLFKREPEVPAGYYYGKSSTYLSTNQLIASSGHSSGFLDDLLRTELLRNELVSLQREALRNEIPTNESFMNSLKAPYLRDDLMTVDPTTNEFFKTEHISNRLNEAKTVGIPLYEQYSCPQYSLEVIPDKDLQPAEQIKLQQSIDISFSEGDFGPPQSGYDSIPDWACAPGPYDFTIDDVGTYPQQPYSVDGNVAEALNPAIVGATDQPPNFANRSTIL